MPLYSAEDAHLPPLPPTPSWAKATATLPTGEPMGAMWGSNALIAFIQKMEGYIATAQPDVDGVYILGYGCKFFDGKPVVAGQTCTVSQAIDALKVHCIEYAENVLSLVNRPLKQGELDALIDFVYNAGLGALRSSSLLRAVNLSQPVTEDLFTRWNKYHDVKTGQIVESSQLTARRKGEYQFYIQP